MPEMAQDALSRETSLLDEPYQVVQVGEDKEEMKRLMQLKYERKQQAKAGLPITSTDKKGGKPDKQKQQQ